MGKGNLLCCGTSLFLKNYYGVGYNMTVSRKQPGVVDGKFLTELVQSFVPKASVLSDVAGEVSYRLPFSASGQFPALFDAMDADVKQDATRPTRLNIKNFGISVTTLEEVFLRVANEETLTQEERIEEIKAIKAVRQISRSKSEELSASLFESGTLQTEKNPAQVEQADNMAVAVSKKDVSKKDEMLGDLSIPDLSDTQWFAFHVRAMFLKRVNNAKRDKRAICCVVLLPVVIFFLGALLTVVGGRADPSEVLFDALSEYGPPNLIPYNTYDTSFGNISLPSYAHEFFSNYQPPAGQPESQISQTQLNFSKFLLASAAGPNEAGPEAARRGAFAFNYDPLAWLPTGDNDSFYVESFPYSWFPRSSPDNSSNVADGAYNLMAVSVMFNTSARDSLPIFLNQLGNIRLRNFYAEKAALPDPPPQIKARVQGFPLTASQSVLFDSGSSIILAMAFCFIPASYGSFVVRERETNSKHLQLISGVGTLAYWTAHFLWDVLTFLLPMLLSLVVAAIFSVETMLKDIDAVIVIMLLYGASVAMFAYLLSFAFRNASNAESVILIVCFITGPILSIIHIVLSILPDTQEVATKLLVYVWRIFPPFCFANSISNLFVRETSVVGYAGKWDMAITGWNCIYMTCETIVFFLMILLIEYIQRTPDILRYFASPPADPKTSFTLDEDIIAEADRVDRGGASGDSIVIRHLRKVYASRLGSGAKVAVHDLSFGIPKGQCFGFLGINGAGKTTTLKMLTGDCLPSEGTAYLSGLDIMSQQTAIRRLLGYCPQFDALLPNLTARETLMLYARLKGLNESMLPNYIARMLTRLGLDEYADKPCKGYSGGNKRKLSVGMALIGNPSILFLDEPSTGMDPKSRRFMWELIASTMQGRSVILTTHSMEECEALCARIGIMVGGRLRCLGSSQHLKSRYSDGYQVDVNTSEDKVQLVDSFLCSSFPGAKLVEAHGGSLKYSVAKVFSLGAMFRLVESKKQELGLANYSIAEMSLEQIFILFAKQQDEERGQVAGLALPAQESQALESPILLPKPSQPMLLSHPSEQPNQELGTVSPTGQPAFQPLDEIATLTTSSTSSLIA
eukprot:gb/GEZN01000735.1/.p1 GENE.gb/GEZN01000735.1/~~gb/GEZN01000735.1/.p1  ORF type:complete len:1181 (-),score=199.45 gb/GEZN01000735.1/:231-3473(-)